MIHIRHLTKAYPSALPTDGPPSPVLRDVSLSVKRGELVAIVGRSGSGKSTLLNALGGLDVTYDGEVEVDGCVLKTLSDDALSRFRGSAIGFVFQAFNLLAPLTAHENVLLASYFGQRPETKATEAFATTCLERVGLGGKMARKPNELSGGERQRVAIARALLNRPRVLLCDEPTGNLDLTTGNEVIELFSRLTHEEQLATVVVTHEERVFRVADRVLALEEGTLREVAQ